MTSIVPQIQREREQNKEEIVRKILVKRAFATDKASLFWYNTVR